MTRHKCRKANCSLLFFSRSYFSFKVNPCLERIKSIIKIETSVLDKVFFLWRELNKLQKQEREKESRCFQNGKNLGGGGLVRLNTVVKESGGGCVRRGWETVTAPPTPRGEIIRGQRTQGRQGKCIHLVCQLFHKNIFLYHVLL